MTFHSRYWKLWVDIHPRRVIQYGRHFYCAVVRNSLSVSQNYTDRRYSRMPSSLTKSCHITHISTISFVIQRQILVKKDNMCITQPFNTYSSKVNSELTIDSKHNTKKIQGDVTATSLTEMAEEVVEYFKNEPMFNDSSLSVALVEERIQTLVDIGHVPVKMKTLIQQSPTLLTCARFSNKVRHLIDYGFTAEHVSKFCNDCPQVFDLSEEQVSQFIEHLRRKGFVQEKLISIISCKPDILTTSPSTIIRRIEELKTMFKSMDVFDLCVKSPHVLDQSFSEIKSKFDYVYHVMGITQRQIMYSRLFDHTLQHIQNRCTFVLRAGLYKKIQKNAGEKNTNPLLQDIIDSKDKDFVKKFGNMSVLDYNAFCLMMDIERRQQPEQDISSDDDTSYDSEDSE